MANPLVNPNLFDTFKLAGVLSPGTCEVSGAKMDRRWDVKQGYGLGGGTVVFVGDSLVEFTARLTFWTPEQINEYNADLVPLLKSPPPSFRDGEPQGKALSFFHGYVSEPPLNVSAVVVKSVTQIEQVADGLFQVQITFLQHRAPRPQLSQPIAAVTDEKPTPRDWYERKILEMDERVKKTANRKPGDPFFF